MIDDVTTLLVQGLATALHSRTNLPVYTTYEDGDNEYPCFFIEVYEHTQEQALNNQLHMGYKMRVHFLATANGKMQDSDMNLVRLMQYQMPLMANVITVGDRVVRLAEPARVTHTDDVIIMHCSYNITVEIPTVQADAMQQLHTKGMVKDGRNN